jgi:hypothetical protein
VGSADSKKPARIGFTRDQVIAALGPPQYATADMSHIAYRWVVLEGFWIAPLCGGFPKTIGHRVLVMNFNDGGYFASYQVLEASGRGPNMIGAADAPPRPPVPSDMRPYPIGDPFAKVPTTQYIRK